MFEISKAIDIDTSIPLQCFVLQSFQPGEVLTEIEKTTTKFFESAPQMHSVYKNKLNNIDGQNR